MRERERKRDGYLTSGSHAKAERGVERERERCEGEREQPFNKEGGGKGGEQSKRGHSPQGGAGEEATAKKSWKEGDDGED